MSEFTVNNYLTLKLEDDQTNIYINDEKFIQCKYLLLQLSDSRGKDLEDIDSIDAVAEMLDHSLESINYNDKNILEPKLEFWGHCSNLQAWFENDYDTKLLHSNISFPLLKKLTEVGDPLAKKKFREEITSRLLSGHFNIIIYLLTEGYLNYLTNQELDLILDSSYHEFEFSDEALFLVIKSFILYDQQKKDFADDTFQKALKKTSSISKFKYAWNEIGRAFYEKDEFNKAIEIFQYILKIDPNYKLAWNNLGNVYKETEGYKKSLQYYEKAIEIYPEFEDALFNLAISYNFMKKNKKAIEMHMKILEINPQNFLAWGELGTLYDKKKNYKLRIKYYKKALEIEPQLDLYWFNLGSTYAELMEFNKAIEAFENVVKFSPDFADAWDSLGYLYSKIDDSDNALKAYNNALKYNSELENSWYGLALEYYARKNYNKALSALKMALKVYPNFKKAKKLLKIVYKEKNKIEDDEEVLQNLIFLEDNLDKVEPSKVHQPTFESLEIKWSFEDELKRNELKNNARDSIDFIEERLRGLIKGKLEAYYNYSWWEMGIPKIIRKQVESDLINRKKINPGREYNRLNLLTFSNYKEIICYKKNWNQIFKEIFYEKYNVQYPIENIRYIRNDIFHNNFYENDFLKLKLLIEELLKNLEI